MVILWDSFTKKKYVLCGGKYGFFFLRLENAEIKAIMYLTNRLPRRQNKQIRFEKIIQWVNSDSNTRTSVIMHKWIIYILYYHASQVHTLLGLKQVLAVFHLLVVKRNNLFRRGISKLRLLQHHWNSAVISHEVNPKERDASRFSLAHFV